MVSLGAWAIGGWNWGGTDDAAAIEAIRAGLERAGVPVEAVENLTTREEVHAMLSLSEWIDLIIPRGSNELVQSIQANTRAHQKASASVAQNFEAILMSARRSAARLPELAAATADLRSEVLGSTRQKTGVGDGS